MRSKTIDWYFFSAVPWHINAHPPERDAMRFAAENRNVTRVMRITVRHIPSRPRRPHTHTKSHLISFSSYCDRNQWNHCLSIELTVHGKWTWIRFRFDLSVMWAFDLIRSNKTTTTKIFRLQSINSLRTLCPNERAHAKSKISTKFDLSASSPVPIASTIRLERRSIQENTFTHGNVSICGHIWFRREVRLEIVDKTNSAVLPCDKMWIVDMNGVYNILLSVRSSYK